MRERRGGYVIVWKLTHNEKKNLQKSKITCVGEQDFLLLPWKVEIVNAALPSHDMCSIMEDDAYIMIIDDDDDDDVENPFQLNIYYHKDSLSFFTTCI